MNSSAAVNPVSISVLTGDGDTVADDDNEDDEDETGVQDDTVEKHFCSVWQGLPRLVSAFTSSLATCGARETFGAKCLSYLHKMKRTYNSQTDKDGQANDKPTNK